MPEEKTYLEMDEYEHCIITNALNDMRNELIEEKRPTDAVDDLLLKVIDAPKKKKRWFRREER